MEHCYQRDIVTDRWGKDRPLEQIDRKYSVANKSLLTTGHCYRQDIVIDRILLLMEQIDRMSFSKRDIVNNGTLLPMEHCYRHDIVYDRTLLLTDEERQTTEANRLKYFVTSRTLLLTGNCYRQKLLPMGHCYRRDIDTDR